MREMLFSILTLTATASALCAAFLLLRRVVPRGAGLLWRRMAFYLLPVVLLIPARFALPIIQTPTVAQEPAPIAAMAELEPTTPQVSFNGANPIVETTPIAQRPAREKIQIPYEAVLLATWAAGTLFCLARSFAAMRRLRREIANAPLLKIRREYDLRASAKGPATCGVFRPVILLSDAARALPDEELRMILLHERAHIRRADAARLWLLEICRALYWWNPIVRIALRGLRRDIELFCDADAARGLDAEGRLCYGKALIGMATARPGGLLLAAAEMPVRERILQLVERRPRRWAAVAAVCALALITAACAVRPVAETPVATPQAPTPSEIAVPKPTESAPETTDKYSVEYHGESAETISRRYLLTKSLDISFPMWEDVKDAYPPEATLIVTDPLTGRSFQARRTGGANHMKIEPLTGDDQAVMESMWQDDDGLYMPQYVVVVGDVDAEVVDGVLFIDTQPMGIATLEYNPAWEGDAALYFLGSTADGAEDPSMASLHIGLLGVYKRWRESEEVQDLSDTTRTELEALSEDGGKTWRIHMLMTGTWDTSSR